jgi:hypothetical protein
VKRLLQIAAGVILATSMTVDAATSIHLDFDVRMQPDTKKPDTFICTTIVKDLDTDQVLSAPRLVFLAGKESRASATVGDLHIIIVAFADRSSPKATLQVQAKRSGEVIASQKMTLSLAR